MVWVLLLRCGPGWASPGVPARLSEERALCCSIPLLAFQTGAALVMLPHAHVGWDCQHGRPRGSPEDAVIDTALETCLAESANNLILPMLQALSAEEKSPYGREMQGCSLAK